MSILEHDILPEPAIERHSATDDDIVFESFGRCCNQDGFFSDFYDRFTGSSTAIRAKFSNTDMKRQRYLLRDGILQLILYARGMPDNRLRALGRSHGRSGHRITPQWYDLWLETLIETLAEHDPDFDAEIEAAWRRVLRPGLDLMKKAY